MKALLLACVLLLSSCGGAGLREQVDQLNRDLAEARAQPPTETIVEKVKEVVVNQTVKEVVKDTTALLNWYKIIGMSLMGLSIGFYIIARTLFPFVAVIGLGGFGTGATFFGVSLSTQIALGWLPYFLFAWLVIASILTLVYILRHVDWTPDEREALDDIRNGRDTALGRKLLLDLDKLKNQGGGVVAPTPT